MKVSEGIRRILKQQNMSQNKLATLSGVSTTAVGYILSDKRSPTVDTLDKFANALNVNTFNFFRVESDSDFQDITLINLFKKSDAKIRKAIMLLLSNSDYLSLEGAVQGAPLKEPPSFYDAGSGTAPDYGTASGLETATISSMASGSEGTTPVSDTEFSSGTVSSSEAISVSGMASGSGSNISFGHFITDDPANITLLSYDEIIKKRYYDIKNDFAIIAKDSMCGSGIKRGDVIIVHPQEKLKRGQTGLVVVDGYIKTIKLDSDSGKPNAKKKEYDAIKNKISIVGRVINIIKS